jgi:hypothetical protein
MRIESPEDAVYPMQGPEAPFSWCVRDFPCFVSNDIHKLEVTR